MKIEVWHLGYVNNGAELTLNEIRFHGNLLFARGYYFGVLDGNEYTFTVCGMDDLNEKLRFWLNAF